MDDLVLKLILKAKDEMSSTIKKAASASDDDFQKLQKRLSGVADGFDSFGKKSLIAGVAIGAPLAIGIKKAADFEQQLSGIQAVTGATSTEMSKMRALALKEGADTKYSALEAAQGIEELEKAGVSTAQVLNGGLNGALSLAAAGDIGLADAAEIASTALNAFRDDNLTVSKAADILAGAANASATSVGELKYSLSMCSAVASGVGFSFKDTNTALALLAQNGLKGSDAGTSLKTMLMNLTPHTKKQCEAFVELGLAQGQVIKDAKTGKKHLEMTSNAFYDQHGNIKSLASITGILHDKLKNLTNQERMSSLQMLFGTDAVRAANIMYREGADGANAMWTAMSKVTAEKTAAIKMNNLKGSIEQLSGSVETASISYGSSLIPVIKVATDIVTGLTNAFGAVPAPIQKIIASTTALASISLIGLGAVSLACGGVVRGYSDMLSIQRLIGKSDIASKFTKITDSMSMKNMKISINPYKAITGGLANAQLKLKSFGKNIRETAIGGVGSLKIGFTGIIPAIKKSASNMQEFLLLSKTNAINGFKTSLSAIQSGFVNFVPNCKKAMNTLKSFNLVLSLNPVGVAVAAFAVGAFIVMKYWKPITAFFKGFFNGLKIGLAPLAPAFHKISNAVKPIVDWCKRLFSPINTAGKASENFGTKLGKAIGGAITWTAKLISNFTKLVTLGGRIHIGGNTSVKSAGTKVDGSHANGLSRVPFDGYIAETHKNESILTSGEAKEWRNYKSGNTSSNKIVITYSPQVKLDSGESNLEVKLMNVLKTHAKELVSIVENVYSRKYARAYDS